MEVSRYQHVLGGLLEKAPGWLIALGKAEEKWNEADISGISIDRPIYIAGLARSGSTLLLELLSSHPDTATHRYRDFPLVHIPIWWNWFLDRAGKASGEPVERAHQDRIQVTPESPEAMEEVLWMAFFPDCHNPSLSNVISSAASPAFAAYYRAHLRKILLLRGATRYLSKGNYNVTRLAFLHSIFPDAKFIVPVRDPIWHVASLSKQHRLFCDVERQNSQVLDYMRRCGHFEFGLDRRPINFGDLEEVHRIQNLFSTGDEVRGLAACWAGVYGHVLEVLESNPALARQALLVQYEEMCENAGEVLRQVYDHCELPVDCPMLERQARLVSAPDYYKHGFSAKEIEAIDEETTAVKARLAMKRSSQTAATN